MPKAKSLDRIELTKKKMQAREAFVSGLITKEDLEKKKNSSFLMIVAEMKQEHPEEAHNDFVCPNCGGEMIRSESCYRCKKCGWAKC